MDDLIVIGGGSGGLNLASAAAAVGARVTLVEKFRLGGECTFSACVPSKALIEAARAVQQIRLASRFGLRVPEPEIDFAAVMDRVRSVVEQFAATDSASHLERKGIRVVFGDPEFEAYDTLLVEGQRLHARRFVIATGSRPRVPDIPGLASTGYLDNVSFWALRERPDSLIIFGGGPVGIELGQALARLGTSVTILEAADHLLPREDPEVSSLLRHSLESEGITVLTGAEVLGVSALDLQKQVRVRLARESRDLFASEILVATGRQPNVEGLNLKSVGVRLDPANGIQVDDHLRTYAPNIWAIGDVNGLDLSTHAAERQASVAFRNAVLGLSARYHRTTIPRACFSDPELASVGLSEPQARTLHDEIRVFRADLADNDRARIAAQTGLLKVIATPSGRLLGASVLGPDASLLLHEFVLAMEQGIPLGQLANVVHIYPTVASAIRKVANAFAASRLEKPVVRTALRWIYGYDPASPANDDPANQNPTGDRSTSEFRILSK